MSVEGYQRGMRMMRGLPRRKHGETPLAQCSNKMDVVSLSHVPSFVGLLLVFLQVEADTCASVAGRRFSAPTYTSMQDRAASAKFSLGQAMRDEVSNYAAEARTAH